MRTIRLQRLVLSISFALLAATFLTGSIARAAIVSSWNNAAVGDWTDASKWSNGVPGAGDTANIATPNTGPTVSTNITAGTVNMTNGSAITIQGGAKLTVTTMTISQINSAQGPGTLEIPAGGTLTTNAAANATTYLYLNLKNDGTVICNSGFLSITGGESTGTFTATQPNTLITMPLPGANTMIIKGGALNGHFQVGGFGNSALQFDPANFNFGGTLELYDFLSGGGSLNLTSGGTINIHNPGFGRTPGFALPVHILTGATLHIVADAFGNSLSNTSNLLVDGTFQFDPSSQLYLNAAAATCVFNSDFALIGSITGNGKTTLNAGKTITSTNALGANQIASDFDNFGTLTVASGKVEIGNTVNKSTGILTATAAGTEISLVQGLKTLLNQGAINGTLRVRNGVLNLPGPFTFAGNLILDNGVLQGTGPLTLNNPLKLDSLSGFKENFIQIPTVFPASSGIIADTGRNLNFSNSNFAFDCDVSINASAFTIESSRTLTFNKALNLTAATLGGGGSFVLGTTATATGTATINGALTNNGTLSPGQPTGVITVGGAYTQSSTGTLKLELAGATAGSFDQLVVNGTANLAGTLNVSLINAYVPGADEFTMATYFNHVGSWATNTLPVSPVGVLSVNNQNTKLNFPGSGTTPTLTLLKPSSIVAGHEDFGLIVNGTDFADDAVVKINGSARQSATLSPTALLAIITANDVAQLGTASIIVSNLSGAGPASNALQLSIVSAGGGGNVIQSPKLQVKLNFAKPNLDSITFSGSVPAADIQINGLVLKFAVGGAQFTVTLNDKGKNADKTGPVTTFSKPKNGVSKFTFKVSKAALASFFVSSKLTDRTTKAEAVTVPASIAVGANIYAGDMNLKYTATQGKSGTAK